MDREYDMLVEELCEEEAAYRGALHRVMEELEREAMGVDATVYPLLSWMESMQSLVLLHDIVKNPFDLNKSTVFANLLVLYFPCVRYAEQALNLLNSQIPTPLPSDLCSFLKYRPQHYAASFEALAHFSAAYTPIASVCASTIEQLQREKRYARYSIYVQRIAIDIYRPTSCTIPLLFSKHIRHLILADDVAIRGLLGFRQSVQFLLFNDMVLILKHTSGMCAYHDHIPLNDIVNITQEASRVSIITTQKQYVFFCEEPELWRHQIKKAVQEKKRYHKRGSMSSMRASLSKSHLRFQFMNQVRCGRCSQVIQLFSYRMMCYGHSQILCFGCSRRQEGTDYQHMVLPHPGPRETRMYRLAHLYRAALEENIPHLIPPHLVNVFVLSASLYPLLSSLDGAGSTLHQLLEPLTAHLFQKYFLSLSSLPSKGCGVIEAAHHLLPHSLLGDLDAPMQTLEQLKERERDPELHTIWERIRQSMYTALEERHSWTVVQDMGRMLSFTSAFRRREWMNGQGPLLHDSLWTSINGKGSLRFVCFKTSIYLVQDGRIVLSSSSLSKQRYRLQCSASSRSITLESMSSREALYLPIEYDYNAAVDAFYQCEAFLEIQEEPHNAVPGWKECWNAGMLGFSV